jgi:hypothetical protein
MVRLIPKTYWGYGALASMFSAIVLFLTQKVFDWYGATTFDKAIFTLLVLFLIFLGIGMHIVAHKTISNALKGSPQKIVVNTLILGFAGVLLYLVVANGMAIQMSVDSGSGDYSSYFNNNVGFFGSLKMLMHSAEPNVIEDFAIGVQQIVRTMFIIVPALIVGWGALSVLTADSLDEAEGGILALVAAILVWIMLFIFDLIGIPMW